MKGGGAHRVPLSDAALAVLEQARALDDGSGLIFPSSLRAGRPLSDMSLTKLLRDRGLADRATVHGFRSAFRDWCADVGAPREVAEAARAHTVGGVEGAYFRSDLLERRHALMDAWAAFPGTFAVTVSRPCESRFWTASGITSGGGWNRAIRARRRRRNGQPAPQLAARQRHPSRAPCARVVQRNASLPRALVWVRIMFSATLA